MVINTARRARAPFGRRGDAADQQRFASRLWLQPRVERGRHGLAAQAHQRRQPCAAEPLRRGAGGVEQRGAASHHVFRRGERCGHQPRPGVAQMQRHGLLPRLRGAPGVRRRARGPGGVAALLGRAACDATAAPRHARPGLPPVRRPVPCSCRVSGAVSNTEVRTPTIAQQRPRLNLQGRGCRASHSEPRACCSAPQRLPWRCVCASDSNGPAAC